MNSIKLHINHICSPSSGFFAKLVEHEHSEGNIWVGVKEDIDENDLLSADIHYLIVEITSLKLHASIR